MEPEYANQTASALYAKGGVSAGLGRGPEQLDRAPLTLDAMKRMDHALEMAAEISSRLYSVRDRIFGSTPDAPQMGSGSMNGPSNTSSCFSEVYFEKAQYLSNALNVIDRLSSEIANRL